MITNSMVTVRTVLMVSFLLAVFAGLVYITGSYAARRIVKTGLERVKPHLTERGIVLNKLTYGDVRLESYRSFSIKDIVLDFDVEKPIYDRQAFHALLDAERILIRIVNIKSPAFLVEIDDFDLILQDADQVTGRPFGTFEHAFWRSEIPLKLYTLDVSAQLISDRLHTLFRENSVEDRIFFQSVVRLNLDGKSAETMIYTVREDNRTYLRMDEGSLLKAAGTFDMEMAPATAALIARHPAKAAHLIKITRDVIRETEKLNGADGYTRDAYKHILWSYELTRIFGPAFAETFTDTHETKPGNTTAERRMDFHNNAVGRQYAVEGVEASQLLHKLKTDPNVMLRPE
jgi:hypothetical protein